MLNKKILINDGMFFEELMGLTNFIPKMIYANIISLLNSVYKQMCTWLNNKGNLNQNKTLIVLFIKFCFRKLQRTNHT